MSKLNQKTSPRYFSVIIIGSVLYIPYQHSLEKIVFNQYMVQFYIAA